MDRSQTPTEAKPRHVVDDRMMLASVAKALFDSAASAPVRAGRFVIDDRIGAGGMGTVYRAHDPDLDRRVALKVLLQDSHLDGRMMERLQREAVALARLNHPNVVTVYEIGTAEHELFIAMEYVEGCDLKAWAEAHPVGPRPRLQQALKLLRSAGRGLAAAHRAGLVHRDFKPSNVLIGDDGRVRVADFGLVRDGDEAPSHEPSAEVPSEPSDLTQTGTTLGTPRYMSPEQQRGATVDARSDQFSFCVAAWIVLFGEPPWPGPVPMPSVQPPRAPASAPGWIVDVLRRGLHEDPELRYPSMAPLIAALGRDPRRRRIVLGLGTGVLVASSFAAAAYA
ncbi:MAG: serine/threonine-protein kinase, partial [Myxococcota bacterium]